MWGNDNRALWNRVASVPAEAKKPITGGTMNGKTDINPMWRLRTLTEVFGPCGSGWRYSIDRVWNETVGDQVMCFAQVSISYREEGEWSDPVPGIGGNTLLKNNRPSDEGYKMAVTDAISVCCKALGIGSDVYWQGGESKYEAQEEPAQQPESTMCTNRTEGLSRIDRINRFLADNNMTMDDMSILVDTLTKAGTVVNKHTKDMTDAEFDDMILAVSRDVVENSGNQTRRAG